MAELPSPQVLTPERVDILGVPVDCVDMAGAVAIVRDAIRRDKRLTVLAVNPEKVMTARRDSATLTSLRKSGLLIPDGIGVVWAAKFLSGKAVARVPGAELMPELCQLAVREGYKVFLYGAAPDVVERACAHLSANWPGLQIAGYQHGYVSESEMPAFIETIKASAADILFVALGSPRQELWIERHMQELPVKVYQGVGGTFDVLAGEVKRAPAAFRRFHLEWFYRLIANPKRIARQSVYPIFVIMVVWQKIRRAIGRDTSSNKAS